MAALALVMLVACPASAAEGIPAVLQGDREVWMDNDGQPPVHVGTVHFGQASGSGQVPFHFTLDEAAFGEYFLAMRPMRCLAGPGEHVCHFPFPGRTELSAGDLVPLEYALLFLHKKPAVLSLDPRDGMYWKLQLHQDRIVGELWDADFDAIVAPSGHSERPLAADDLQLADPASHWLARLRIQ